MKLSTTDDWTKSGPNMTHHLLTLLPETALSVNIIFGSNHTNQTQLPDENDADIKTTKRTPPLPTLAPHLLEAPDNETILNSTVSFIVYVGT